MLKPSARYTPFDHKSNGEILKAKLKKCKQFRENSVTTKRNRHVDLTYLDSYRLFCNTTQQEKETKDVH
jgi:hypothetical protein